MTSKLKLGSKIPLSEVDDISQKADIDFLNVSSDAKKNANVWDAPDYTKGIRISWSPGTVSGTFDKDGWFLSSLAATAGSVPVTNIEVYVNNSQVNLISPSTIGSQNTNMIKVKKGDTYKIITPTGELWGNWSLYIFFPFRY